MARNITAVLRDIDTIKKSTYLTAPQKTAAIEDLQKEITEIVGQGKLPLDGEQETGKPRK